MKEIDNYIIEKLKLTKGNKLVNTDIYEFFDGIKIDVPFDFFVTEKQDYVTISKIKYKEEDLFEKWDFFEYNKKTNKYNLFVTLSKMGVKNIIMKNEQNARPLIKYFHGIKYNDYSSLEVCHHDKVVIKESINEKLKLTKGSKFRTYNYYPKTKKELINLITKLIQERGEDADLNDIDTSEIIDMSYVFQYSLFNGDISEWNVSNVENMNYMFWYSKFNGNISDWDVSNVEDMSEMFEFSKFNQNINNWKISKETLIRDMFRGCPLEKNPPKWYINQK